jgi:hypothetical protein
MNLYAYIYASKYKYSHYETHERINLIVREESIRTKKIIKKKTKKIIKNPKKSL